MGHQLDDGQGGCKLCKGSIEADHVVDNREEDEGEEEEDWQLGKLPADEVRVRPVHPVEVLSQEYRQFEAEYVDHGEHV